MSTAAPRAQPRRTWRKAAGLGALCVLLAATVGSPTLTYRFGRDQAMYACLGEQWLAGRIPYRDSWDNKPPATYALHALTIAAFGHSEIGLRVTDLLLTLGIVAGLFVLIRAMVGDVAAGVAAAGYCFAYYLHFDYWDTAQSEAPTSLFGLLGLIVAWYLPNCSSRGLAAFLAGACVGLSALFKLTGAFVLPVVVALAIWPRKGRRSWLEAVRLSSTIAVGLVIPLAIAVVYFAAHGSLQHMWDVVIRFNMVYAGERMDRTPLAAVGSALGRAGSGLAILVPLALAGLWEACHDVRKAHHACVLAWFAASFLMVLLQHRFFWYHWLAVLPALSALAGIGAAALTTGLSGTHSRYSRATYAVIATAVAIGMMVYTPSEVRSSYKNAIRFLLGGMSLQGYEACFTRGYDYDYAEAKATAAHIARYTDPDETVVLWGYEPEVHFLARRRAPSRFIGTHPLADPQLPYRQDQWRREFLADCRRAPPAYFVTHFARHSRESPIELHSFPDVRQFVSEHYALECVIGQFRLYRHAHPARH